MRSDVFRTLIGDAFRTAFGNSRACGRCLLLRALCLTMLLPVAPPAAAQESPGALERIQGVIRSLARGIETVGEKAEDYLGPGLDFSLGEAEHTATRTITRQFPVDAAPRVALSNEFGTIRVRTWEDRVVQVRLEVRVGADTEDTAAELADGVVLQTQAAPDAVAIRTGFPETDGRGGRVAITADYDVRVPAGAELQVENFFGDTAVRGLRGPLSVDAQYGALDLHDLAGPVSVEHRGDFPVTATGLREGGSFRLQQSRASFDDVAGTLALDLFRGETLLRGLHADATLDATVESGRLQAALEEGVARSVQATLLHGQLESSLPLTRSVQANRIVARLPQVDPRQRINIAATFSDVTLRYAETPGTGTTASTADTTPVNDVITRTLEPPPGLPLVIEAAPGDLRIVGHDRNVIELEATRAVWVERATDAPDALQHLDVTFDVEPDRIALRSVMGAAYADSANAYRVDLVLRVPRALPMKVQAERGRTAIEGVVAPVEVNQREGAVHVEGCRGPVTIDNDNGDVTALQLGDAVEVNARYGFVQLVDIAGPITSRCTQGRTVIESPRAGVFVRNVGGDARILAFEGIGGPYDVLVEDGNLSLLLAPESDAHLSLVARNGRIDSALPLTGTTRRHLQDFETRLNNGTHPVQLETRNGDIVLD